MEETDPKIVSRNEDLLIKLRQIVLNNLENEQFGVLELSSESGYSRSQLYRKIKLINGKSISGFVRDIRLEEALKLIINNAATISEIAYKVGFSSPTYFSRCFHKKYGHTPFEIRTMAEKEGHSAIISRFGSQSDKKVNRFRLTTLKWTIGIAVSILIVVVYIISGNPRLEDTNGQISLAVLPLDNLSTDSEAIYFTEGMQDAIIGALGRISALRVISRTSTLKFRNAKIPLSKVANELDVKLLIEGSVYYVRDSAKIQLQLIKVYPKEEHLWAGEFYINLKDALSVQDDMVQKIANEINITITPQEKRQLTRNRSLNIETYKSYLRGMYFINKHSPKEFMKGMEFLQEAVEKDPADPLAYAGLAMGYAQMGHGPDPRMRYWQRGKAAALKAISLDSTITEPYVALAIIKGYYEYDWQEAERLFLKANEMNNNLAISHFSHAWQLVILGRYDEAVKEHLLAKKLDPLTPIYTADMGSLYYWMNRPDDAIREIKQALELDDNFDHGWWALGNAYVQKGMFNKAIEVHKKADSINHNWKWALGNTYALAGKTDKAYEIIEELESSQITPRTAFGLFFIHNSLGEMDEAYEWLKYEPQDFWISILGTWPGLNKFRQDPRFKQLLIDKNLPPVKPYSETIN